MLKTKTLLGVALCGTLLVSCKTTVGQTAPPAASAQNAHGITTLALP